VERSGRGLRRGPSALLVSLKTPPDWRLHYACSLDGGKTSSVEGLLEPAYEFEEASQYRATLLKTSANPHTYSDLVFRG
jgi:hypothetical protein